MDERGEGAMEGEERSGERVKGEGMRWGIFNHLHSTTVMVRSCPVSARDSPSLETAQWVILGQLQQTQSADVYVQHIARHYHHIQV